MGQAGRVGAPHSVWEPPGSPVGTQDHSTARLSLLPHRFPQVPLGAGVHPRAGLVLKGKGHRVRGGGEGTWECAPPVQAGRPEGNPVPGQATLCAQQTPGALKSAGLPLESRGGRPALMDPNLFKTPGASTLEDIQEQKKASLISQRQGH